MVKDWETKGIEDVDILRRSTNPRIWKLNEDEKILSREDSEAHWPNLRWTTG